MRGSRSVWGSTEECTEPRDRVRFKKYPQKTGIGRANHTTTAHRTAAWLSPRTTETHDDEQEGRGAAVPSCAPVGVSVVKGKPRPAATAPHQATRGVARPSKAARRRPETARRKDGHGQTSPFPRPKYSETGLPWHACSGDMHACALEDRHVGCRQGQHAARKWRACACVTCIGYQGARIASMQATCMSSQALHACAGLPMSAERPGGWIPDQYLRTNVRAECTVAGAEFSTVGWRRMMSARRRRRMDRAPGPQRCETAGLRKARSRRRPARAEPRRRPMAYPDREAFRKFVASRVLGYVLISPAPIGPSSPYVPRPFL